MIRICLSLSLLLMERNVPITRTALVYTTLFHWFIYLCDRLFLHFFPRSCFSNGNNTYSEYDAGKFYA